MFDWEEEAPSSEFEKEIQQFVNQLSTNSVSFYDSDRFEYFIDYFLADGNLITAISVCKAALVFYPYAEVFHMRKAQALAANGELKSALKSIAKAESLSIANAELLATKASIYSQMLDSKRAIEFYKRALEIGKGCEEYDDILSDLITEYFRMKKYDEVISLLTKDGEQFPNNEEMLSNLAFSYEQLGQLEKATNLYEEFLEKNPFSYTAWYNLGNTYARKEEHNKALESYDFALTIASDFTPAAFNKGNSELNLELFSDAENTFRYCLELEPNDPMALCYLGEALENLERYSDAWEAYQQSLSFAPELSEAWIGLGIIKDLQGESALAIPYIEHAISLDPLMDGYQHVLAGAFENINNNEEAKIAYQKCLELNAQNEDCFFDYIEFLLEIEGSNSLKEIEEMCLESQCEYRSVAWVYVLIWKGENEAAELYFISLLQQSRSMAETIFERYESLKKSSLYTIYLHSM
jgi:tetratricopeptide (TPR) repeat protein